MFYVPTKLLFAIVLTRPRPNPHENRPYKSQELRYTRRWTCHKDTRDESWLTLIDY